MNGKDSIVFQNIDQISGLNQPFTMNQFVLGSFNGTKYSIGYFDNICIDNSEAPVRPRIIGLVPNGAGSYTDFIKSDEALQNFECINEVPSDDGDTFVLSNTPGEKDSYLVADLPPLYSSVKCIQVAANAWYEGEATAKAISLFIKMQGTETESFSPIMNLQKYPRGYTYIVSTSPDTNQPFSDAEINGIQIGVRAELEQ